MSLTPEQAGTLVNAGVTAAQVVMQIIASIRADSGMSAAQKEAAVARILAELKDEIAEVKADAAHVDQVDDANRG